MLEGFEVVRLSAEGPNILISKNGVTFNKAAIVYFGETEWVTLLRNAGKKQLAVIAADTPDEDSLPFYNPKKKSNNVVRWTNRKLLRLIELDMDWNLKEANYKIFAEPIDGTKGLLFDLSQALTIL